MNSPDHFRRIPTSERANPAVSEVFNDIDTGSAMNIIINDDAMILEIPDSVSTEGSPSESKD